MNPEETRALVARFMDELWTKRNMAVIDELIAEDWVWHNPPPASPGNRDTFREVAEHNFEALEDTGIEIEQCVVEGDKVATKCLYSGRCTGQFAGVPAAGKQVSIGVMSIDRIEDGKCMERWDIPDSLGAMQQVGAFPPLGPFE